MAEMNFSPLSWLAASAIDIPKTLQNSVATGRFLREIAYTPQYAQGASQEIASSGQPFAQSRSLQALVDPTAALGAVQGYDLATYRADNRGQLGEQERLLNETQQAYNSVMSDLKTIPNRSQSLVAQGRMEDARKLNESMPALEAEAKRLLNLLKRLKPEIYGSEFVAVAPPSSVPNQEKVATEEDVRMLITNSQDANGNLDAAKFFSKANEIGLRGSLTDKSSPAADAWNQAKIVSEATATATETRRDVAKSAREVASTVSNAKTEAIKSYRGSEEGKIAFAANTLLKGLDKIYSLAKGGNPAAIQAIYVYSAKAADPNSAVLISEANAQQSTSYWAQIKAKFQGLTEDQRSQGVDGAYNNAKVQLENRLKTSAEGLTAYLNATNEELGKLDQSAAKLTESDFLPATVSIPEPPSEGGGKSEPVRVNTPSEAMALPKGTVFITPDGKRKVR